MSCVGVSGVGRGLDPDIGEARFAVYVVIFPRFVGNSDVFCRCPTPMPVAVAVVLATVISAAVKPCHRSRCHRGGAGCEAVVAAIAEDSAMDITKGRRRDGHEQGRRGRGGGCQAEPGLGVSDRRLKPGILACPQNKLAALTIY
jgi:hypothetical protein